MSTIHAIAVVAEWILCILAAGIGGLFLLTWIIAKTEGPYGGPFADEHVEPERQPETPPYPSLYV